MNKIKSVTWMISGSLVVVMLVGGFWLFETKHANAATTNYITGVVKNGNIEKTVNATGTVEPSSQYNLSANSGKITEIDVKVGDSVKAGQVLAKFDPTQSQQQVTQAQANLTQAQLKLSQLQAPPSQVSVLNAQDAVTKAQTNVSNALTSLQTLQSYKNADTLKAAITKAQGSGGQGSQLSTLQDYANNSADLTATIAQATNVYNNAQADLNLARAQLAQANAGPNSTDLQLAESQVSQAKTALSTAQATLSNTIITAPADGIVTAVNGQVGENAGSGQSSSGQGSSGQGSSASFITLIGNSGTMQIVVPVNEADIANVQVGQSASITLNAYPGQTFTGSIIQVNPTGDTQSGVTTFGVTVNVSNTDNLMKPGMSANVSIIVAQKENVLTVPSMAVHARGSEQTVSLAPTDASGRPEVRTVKIGLDDGKNAEVLQGLQAGDQVVIGTRSQQTSSSSTKSSLFAGGGFGGSALAGGRGNFGGGAGGVRGGKAGN